jgi:6-phosphogluconolactonase (cycloisomerase 2 family)
LAIAHCAIGTAQSIATRAHADGILAYVGTYTGKPGGDNHGEGIYRFEMNPKTAELSHRKLVATTPSPSWIAIHPSRRFLYAVNEIDDFPGHSGSVIAFAIDRVTGDLSALNTVSSEGAGPAHLAIDVTGKFAFVANYDGGSLTVLPIRADGSLGSAIDIHRESGSVGSMHAADACPGSFAISGHDAPHAHMIAPDVHNNFVLAADLGQDRLYIYRFDQLTGKLTPPEGAPFVALPSGDGPRHFAFHPNGAWLYALQEESSTIVFFRFDPVSGVLEAQQTVSALPNGFAGTSFASDILVSPDGRFLYAANRLHDTIAAFAIDADGRIKPIGETSTLGNYPVQLRFDPEGNFLYVCNLRSDNIASFKVHRETGLITFTGHFTPVGSPGSIVFLQ